MAEHPRPKGLASAVCYKDAKAAFRWLEEAFGFEPAFVLLDADGNLAHSEMEYGNSSIMVGNEWSDDHRSPAHGPPSTCALKLASWCDHNASVSASHCLSSAVAPSFNR